MQNKKIMLHGTDKLRKYIASNKKIPNENLIGLIRDFVTDDTVEELLIRSVKTGMIANIILHRKIDTAFCRAQENILMQNRHALLAPDNAKKALSYVLFITNKISEKELGQRLRNIKSTAITTVIPVVRNIPVPATLQSTIILPESETTNRSKSIAFFFLLLLIGIGGYFSFPYFQRINLEQRYNIGYRKTYIRAEPLIGVGAKIDSVKYGQKVWIHSKESDWAVVSNEKGSKGYISMDYLVSKQKFFELNGIFKDAATIKEMGSSKNRLALWQYFQQKNYSGKISQAVQKEIYGRVLNKEIWQVAHNDILKSWMTGNNRPEFICIIQKEQSNQKKLLFFTFDEEGESTLLYEENFTEERKLKRASRNKKWYLGNSLNGSYTLQKPLYGGVYYESNNGQQELFIYQNDALQKIKQP